MNLEFSVLFLGCELSGVLKIIWLFVFYYNGDIDLHSFNNGTSLQNKLGNWSLLQRFFIRQELNIPKDVVNGTIHCKQGAAELLVVYIYRRCFIQGRPSGTPSTLEKSIKSLKNDENW